MRQPGVYTEVESITWYGVACIYLRVEYDVCVQHADYYNPYTGTVSHLDLKTLHAQQLPFGHVCCRPFLIVNPATTSAEDVSVMFAVTPLMHHESL